MILALGLGLAWPGAEALALSAEWQSLSGRERVIIRLDATDGDIGDVARTARASIGLPFSSGARDFSLAAPAPAKLFGGVESAPDGLSLKLKTDEFGFIVTRPASGILHIDIFADPVGKRWKPAEPGHIPAAPVPQPAASASGQAQVAAPPPPAQAAPVPQPAQAAPAPGAEATAVEPSSVFSQKLELPSGQPADEPPAAAVQPAGTAPAVPLPLLNGRAMRQPEGSDEENAYRLPEWPPMSMPPSLPLPPPPSGAGADLLPEFAPESAVVPGRSLQAPGDAPPRNPQAAPGKAISRPHRGGFSPFASPALAAQAEGAAGAGSEELLVRAPFAYRARLNVNEEPDWVEQPIPVFVYAPAGMVLGGNAESAPLPEASAPPPAPARPSAEPARPEALPGAPPTAPEDQGMPETPAAPAAPPTAPETPTASEAPSPAPEEPPAPPQAVPPPPEPLPGVESARAVVYVDEQGNPVEPPLEPEAALRDVELKINDTLYAEAIGTLDKLLGQHNLSQAQREIALHRKADAMFSLYENDLAAHYQAIVDSSTAAVNFNTRSSRNAAAYLRLGYTSIVAGNSYEAAGYFNVLRREYPNYSNLPLTYYYWGDYQYAQGNLADATEQFNYIVNNYPEHPISRDAALGLSRSYYRMGRFDDAFTMAIFVEQRWPNFYLDYPPMLSMLGDVAYRVGNLDKAREAYWLYYNLAPHAEDADMILTRLGDIYASGKYHSAAVQVYGEAVNRFPAKDGGVISLMRIAEDGVYDNPSLSGMVKVFERPYDQRPVEAYRKIIREYPDSPLVTLAKLKLAMWTLWQKDYTTVLDLCSEILSEAPNSPLAERAREVSMSAFTLLAAEDAQDKRYSRAREIWDRYPILQAQAEFLDPESRLSLAVSQWNTGANTEALSTLEPFFYGSKNGEVSEMALFLALNIMTEHYQWEKIADLAQRVELWELTPQAGNQMNYALALAYENLDRPEAAAPLWDGIYTAKLLPPTQLANAAFYLARSAERERDLESAYHVGQDALSRLSGVTQTDPEHADTEKIKTQIVSLLDIAESSGSLQQALDYAGQYLQYAEEGSLDQQSVIYRMARIHKKRGDTGEWLRLLGDLSGKYPDSVFGKTANSELAAHRLDSEAARYSNTQF